MGCGGSKATETAAPKAPAAAPAKATAPPAATSTAKPAAAPAADTTQNTPVREEKVEETKPVEEAPVEIVAVHKTIVEEVRTENGHTVIVEEITTTTTDAAGHQHTVVVDKVIEIEPEQSAAVETAAEPEPAAEPAATNEETKSVSSEEPATETAAEQAPAEQAPAEQAPVEQGPATQTAAAVPAPTSVPAASKPVAPQPPAKKTGMIFKQGHMRKNWKNRYFVLENGVLSYYENSQLKEKKGDMTLRGCTVTCDKTLVTISATEAANAKGQNELVLEIKYPNEREEWLAALKNHIAFYSK